MEKFIVNEGKVQLNGYIRIGGAKNAALPIMAASILCAGTSVIHDVPNLSDIMLMKRILEYLGAEIIYQNNTLFIDAKGINKTDIPENLMREMRASIFLMGALMGRFRTASIFYPGGCAIGHRPIDLHIKALERLGAFVDENHGVITLSASHLVGEKIVFDFPSVGATENAILAAVLAEGRTIIHNAAREPEIVDLTNFLIKMGAEIHGAGNDTIYIDGVKRLNPVEYTIMPDRIQAGTFLLAGAITNGNVVIENITVEHLFALIDKLAELGARISLGNDFIRIKAEKICGIDIKTLPFPGFPTDLQAPMMALLCKAEGTSVITETIFENRFRHVDQLARMGAKILVEGRSAVVRGVNTLKGATVEAMDLRAGGALVLAALGAEGTSTIENIKHIDRGYENFEINLQSLGALIIRAKD
ncbi:UDP-N-acetylglucosamine 1-carboxyvinyltransferase [Anaerosinus sp.]|uniref:UDP-N-acetylglucosamine 1-carboxyvinyltransferase n=1 Tax=Selenobaculum sp. TaxID=3074374 RepID=UPI003AB6DAF4